MAATTVQRESGHAEFERPVSERLSISGSGQFEHGRNQTQDHVKQQPYELDRTFERIPLTETLASTSRPSQNLPRSSSPHARSLWLWEIVASALSFICISCIIVVLRSEQGKPLDQWGLRHWITPTALVSFLGTIGKSACLLVLTEIISQLKWVYFSEKPRRITDLEIFDAASRGPWGAVILATSKHRTTLLATGASLIVLTCLLIDPFLQLVFQFPTNLTPVHGSPPTIRTSQTYDPTSLPKKDVGGYGPAQVASSMQAAILSPIWGVTVPPSLPCFSERCDWPTVTTLGVCSSCVNVTDTAQSSCRIGASNYNRIQCNYTLSSNQTLSAVFGLTGGASDMVPYHTLWNSNSTTSNPLGTDGVGFVGGLAEISGLSFIKIAADLDWAKYLVDTKDGSVTLRANPPIVEAMHCTLDLCARTFTKPYYANSSAVLPDGPKAPLVMQTVPYPDTTRAEVLLAELKPADTNHVPMNTTFKINYFDYSDMVNFFFDLFSVEYLSSGVTTQKSESDGPVITPNVALLLSQTSDISGLFQRIADSMTEEFRTSPNSTTVNGIGKSSRTFIYVRWAWLALPITLVFLTLILLVVVIIQAQSNAVPTWKSSSLALLFHELDGWSQSEREAISLQELKDKAGIMRGQTKTKNGRALISKDNQE